VKKAHTITDQLAAIDQQIADVQARYNSLSVKLVENPSDSQLLREMEALEQEKAEHQRARGRLEVAAREKARRDSKEGKQANLARLKRERADVEMNVKRQGDLLRQVAALISKMTPLVAELEALGNDAASSGFAIFRACAPDRAIQRYEMIMPALRSNTGGVRCAVADALYATGLGRAGLQLAPFVSISRAGTDKSLDEALAEALSRVTENLDQLIARHEAELNGTLPAGEAPPSQDDRFIRGGRNLERNYNFVTLRDRGAL
jgi:hypothetical protein